MKFKRICLLLFLLLFCSKGYSQNVISGIVVDSLSFTSVPEALIKIKNHSRHTESTENGSFIIMASDYDTLIFSAVGYRDLEYPLFGPESEVIVRISPSIKMLREVTINATPPKEIMEK